MEKLCGSCNITKNVSEFYKNSKRKDGLASGCKQCVDAASTKWRHANTKRHEQKKTERHTTTKSLVEQYKRERGCVVCGENNPVCLDMHHLDPSQKETHPSNLISVSYNRWLQEATKCVVVCRNCHAKLHAGVIILVIRDQC
jgi:hypothetical protein